MRIPATSDVAKTSISSTYAARSPPSIGCPTRRSRSRVKLDNRSALGFLPGQYVNIQVPGTDQTRSFSFSSGPRPDEVRLPDPQHRPRRADHLSARPGQGGRPDRVQRPAGQLLPARDQAAGAVPGRRHRPGAVPVHAGQDRAGRRQRAPRPPDLRGDQRRRPGQDRRTGGVRRSGCRTSPSPACVAAEDSSLPEQGLRHPLHRARAPQQRRRRHLPLRAAADGRRGPQASSPTRASHPANFYYEKFSGTGVVCEIGEIHVKAGRVGRGVRRPDGAGAGRGTADRWVG